MLGLRLMFSFFCHPQETEMIINVGYPAAGKSTLSKKYLAKKGYTIINRDTLSTQDKCLKAAEASLQQKKSVVIDNTNPSKEARKVYINLAKKYNSSVRCFMFETSFELAKHLNMYRQSQTLGKVRRIPDVGFNTYKSRYEKPELSEGFCEVKSISFIPKFDSDKDKELFSQWT